jgi:alkylation response protein AidB-like acyl-CoA dehydrogenase
MPTTPFAAEHDALRDTMRRLVEGPLGEAAAAAEAGGTPHAAAFGRLDELGVVGLDDVLAEVVVAEQLGTLRSGGLIAVLLDALLTSSLSLPPLQTAVARDATVTVTDAGATAVVPFVAGGGLADRCLILDQRLVVSLEPGGITGLGRPIALRGSAPASLRFDDADYEHVDVPGPALRRAELREAAAAVGAAWRTWSDASAYAQQREAFGRPISKFQVNRHALADLATRITAAEALVHDTAYALAADGAADTAAARLYAGRLYGDVADRAVQLHGGYGYTTEFDVERAWRDARALRAGDLTLRARLTARGATA